MITAIGSGIPSIGTQQLTSVPQAPSKAAESGGGFADVFKYAVTNVDTLQNNATQQITQMVQGASNVDVGQVSISVEKADVAFQLMMQVRNKIVSAYQDIEKMQF